MIQMISGAFLMTNQSDLIVHEITKSHFFRIKVAIMPTCLHKIA